MGRLTWFLVGQPANQVPVVFFSLLLLLLFRRHAKINDSNLSRATMRSMCTTEIRLVGRKRTHVHFVSVEREERKRPSAVERREERRKTCKLLPCTDGSTVHYARRRAHPPNRCTRPRVVCSRARCAAATINPTLLAGACRRLLTCSIVGTEDRLSISTDWGHDRKLRQSAHRTDFWSMC